MSKRLSRQCGLYIQLFRYGQGNGSIFNWKVRGIFRVKQFCGISKRWSMQSRASWFYIRLLNYGQENVSICTWKVREIVCVIFFITSSYFHLPLDFRALDKNEYNHITATYFLLAERKLRAQRQERAQQINNRISRTDLSPVAITPRSVPSLYLLPVVQFAVKKHLYSPLNS